MQVYVFLFYTNAIFCFKMSDKTLTLHCKVITYFKVEKYYTKIFIKYLNTLSIYCNKWLHVIKFK